MNVEQASKVKLVNALCNILAEAEAKLRVNAIHRMLNAYESGMITAQEFLNADLNFGSNIGDTGAVAILLDGNEN